MHPAGAAAHAPDISPSQGRSLAHPHPGVPHNANGNGHHQEAPDPQQSLFSWAEFMAEEPVKPSRNGKPKPSSLTLFEWAFTLEQEWQDRSRLGQDARPFHSRGGRRNICGGFPRPFTYKALFAFQPGRQEDTLT